MVSIQAFVERRFATGETEIYARIGGSGPPLVCLHGFPQTHLAWRKVAPRLAERFTVVLPDLRGYGASGIVPSDAAHAAYSKRAMARDVIAVMRALGHERFFVAGHDRGARVAYRLALDAPERCAALAVLDIVPTLATFESMDYRAAYNAYHWFFLSQPEPLPEKLIGADPGFYLEQKIRAWLGDPGAIEPEVMAAYRAAIERKGVLHAMCEDYRAGFTYDLDADRADRDAGRRLSMPLLALYGHGPTRARGAHWLEIWRDWADEVAGGPLVCGHFLMEEAPSETGAALEAFFAAVPLEEVAE
jgi:haloacetate dehalogenase